MIHFVSLEIDAILKARGCPIRVIDGPEPTSTTTFARERIVVEHDEDAGDRYLPVKGAFVNPVPRAICAAGYKATFYAQQPSANATPFEHQQRAEHVRDMFVVALTEVAALRKNACVLTGGKFVRPADLAKSEAIGGAVYELTFTFERGIRELKWSGDKHPEVTGVAITSADRVSLTGSSALPETAC